MELSDFVRNDYDDYEVQIHYQINANRAGTVDLESLRDATAVEDLKWKNYELAFGQEDIIDYQSARFDLLGKREGDGEQEFLATDLTYQQLLAKIATLPSKQPAESKDENADLDAWVRINLELAGTGIIPIQQHISLADALTNVDTIIENYLNELQAAHDGSYRYLNADNQFWKITTKPSASDNGYKEYTIKIDNDYLKEIIDRTGKQPSLINGIEIEYTNAGLWYVTLKSTRERDYIWHLRISLLYTASIF